MPLAIGPTELAPFIATLISFTAAILLGRGARAEAKPVWRAQWTVTLGFCTGWVVLHAWRSLAVSRNWHWLFYLAIAAAVAGSPEIGRWRRRAWWGVILAGCAWLLTPQWASPDPPRPVWAGGLTLGMTALALLLEPLPRRMAPRAVLMALIGASGVLAVLVAALYSLMTGATAGIATAAFLGWRLGPQRLVTERSVSAAALLYVVLVGGTAFTAAIYPQPPALSLLAVPAAPLAMWGGVSGPLSRIGSERTQRLIPLMLVFAALIVLAVGIAWPSGAPADEW